MKNFYMQLALNEAWKYQFLTYPNPAVGCVILDKNGKILSIKAHEKASEAHAELNAISVALKYLKPEFNFPKNPNALHEFILANHQNLLQNATAFVTLEPCAHQGKTPPCVQLFVKLGFKKVFISVKDENQIASGGAQILKENGIDVEMGILENEGKNLLMPFLKWQKNQFKLFKLALSINGSHLGKIISNDQSRTYAHKIRSVIDLLVIGGETIKMDKPILDARLCKGKAPDVCILSHSHLDNFDRNLPLFKVPNRRILNHIPKEAKFIMYEGGPNLLHALKDEMDAFLIFHNAKFVNKTNALLELDLHPLHRFCLDDDMCGIYIKKF